MVFRLTGEGCDERRGGTDGGELEWKVGRVCRWQCAFPARLRSLAFPRWPTSSVFVRYSVEKFVFLERVVGFLKKD